jgi:hypothetical protein
MKPRLALVALCGALTVGVLAGCGGSSSGNGVASKPPDQILNAASTAINHASSVHVAGSIASSGVPLTLDLNLVSGKGGRGQISESGLTFQIVDVGSTVYIQGSSAFWQHFGGANAARLLSGRWLKAPATGQFASIAQLTNMQKLMTAILATHGNLSKGGVTTLRGQQVVAVSDKTNGGTLYVATTGHPYPIEIKKTGSSGGQIVFDQFNQPVSLTAPAGAVDLSALG